MNLCVVCGGQLGGEVSLCAHHVSGFEEGWATTNRIMCNLLHRGIVVTRLPETDRDPLDHEDAAEPAAAPLETVAG